MRSSLQVSRRRFLAALPWGLASLAGCAQVQVTSDNETPNRLLPAPRMAPDSVVLEIAHAQIPIGDKAAYEEVWKLTDEQILPVELRQELARNGLRCGVLGNELPEKIRTIISQKTTIADERSEELNTGDVEVDRQVRRLQCRAGRRTKILCSASYPQLSLLARENGSVTGRQLTKAQCQLALKPYPGADGHVRIDLLPEVEHGEVRNHWVSGEGTLMQHVGRDKVAFEQLRMSITLAPRQILVVSSIAEPIGLGDHFFVESAGGSKLRGLVFVRHAFTMHDDLFGPGLSPLPLATPGE
jgi:hypothetical protein